MPVNERIQPSRFQFYQSVSSTEISTIIDDPLVEVVQTCASADQETWDRLNQELFTVRPDITLRVFGFYGEICDLSFLKRMGNVERLSADCLTAAIGIENLACLPRLKSLDVGIYELDSFSFLKDLPSEQVESLSLEATSSKRPELSALDRFRNLRKLYLEGQQKSINVVGNLDKLEDVTLRSIGAIDISFLGHLRNLWSLDIKLGGIRDLSPISGMSQIKYLELWQIKGFDDLSVISTLTGLQFLFLQSLRNVSTLPDFSPLGRLRRLHLDSMKGLTDISALATASALEELFISGSPIGTPEEVKWITKLPNLQRIGVYYGNMKFNAQFEQLAREQGLRQYHSKPFVFV